VSTKTPAPASDAASAECSELAAGAYNCGTSEGCADIEGVPTLVSIVGWFAHPSMEPAFVEECDNSPTFTLVAAVGREDDVGKSCRVGGRDVAL
jgi:hypothetical protein